MLQTKYFKFKHFNFCSYQDHSLIAVHFSNNALISQNMEANIHQPRANAKTWQNVVVEEALRNLRGTTTGFIKVFSQLKQDSIFNLLGLELDFMTFLPRQNKFTFFLTFINCFFKILILLKFLKFFETRQLNRGRSTNRLIAGMNKFLQN
jgi:hypothetical protein